MPRQLVMPESKNTRAPVGALPAIAAGLLALVAALALLTGGSAESAAAAAKKDRPNFVVIQTDDQTLDQLYASYTPPGGATIRTMPNTLRLIAGRGITFTRYYVSYSLCCPSRVTLLTGRYAHNHNVRGNVPPNGGYTGFASRTAFHHNLAVWLQGAGYRTIQIGKFLNGYGDPPYDNGTTVPPGWSAWHAVLNPDTQHSFYGYKMNDNGVINGPFGDIGDPVNRNYGVRDDPGCPDHPANGLTCNYETDHLTQVASDELAATPARRPFFMLLDYTAPHGDFRRPAGPEPAPRYYDSMAGAPLPHTAAQGFNEANISDKPSFIRAIPRLSPSDINVVQTGYDKALESLRSIDDGVKRLVDQLGAEHRLRNTYILFTSDNGAFAGEHRLSGGKFLAYEPSTHLPFLMRGPGIKAGTRSGELVANVDIAPTLLKLAGVRHDRSIDGRSLMPFARDPNRRTSRPILFESFVQSDGESTTEINPARVSGDGASTSASAPARDYYGVRLGRWKYIIWPNGEQELYDEVADPYELKNQVRNGRLRPIRNYMLKLVRRLETCSGQTCREPTPPIPQPRKR